MTRTPRSEPMPAPVRERFEARIQHVVRASALPEVLLDVQVARWEFGASVAEAADVLALTDPPLAREYRRWAS